jgi:hypothetical protein
VKTFSEFLGANKDAINEVALKPSTARAFALMLTVRMTGHRKQVRSATDVGEKIDHLSDLISDAAYMSLLGVAIEQGDQSLLRKIRR